MKSGVKLVAAGFVGAVLGATGMSALNAQTATPQAYLVANVQEVKNPDIYRHVWTAPRWQGLFECFCETGRCGHVFDLLMRRT